MWDPGGLWGVRPEAPYHTVDGIGAQGKKANEEVALPLMSIRLERLLTEIRRDQMRRLLRGERHREVAL